MPLTELEDLELPPEDVPLSVTELEEIASSPLEEETSATGSGPAPLELSSQAAIVNAAITAKPRNRHLAFILFSLIFILITYRHKTRRVLRIIPRANITKK